MKEPYYFKDMSRNQRIKWCLGVGMGTPIALGFVAGFGFMVSQLLKLI